MSIVENRYSGTKDYALEYAELTAAKYRGTVTYQEFAEISSTGNTIMNIGIEADPQFPGIPRVTIPK